MYKCKCGRTFEKSNSLNAHYSHCLIHRNGKPPLDRFKGKQVWNKGYTYEEILGKDKAEEYKNKISSTMKKDYEKNPFSLERKNKISKSIKGKTGGLRKGGGRTKKGWYKGFWCDSSWELAFLIYHLDMGNSIIRNNQFFEYEYNNEKLKYYPDFILNDEYFEIKGYEDEKSKEKKKQFLYKLNILYKEDINFFINYVIKKYGKNFTEMYDIPIKNNKRKLYYDLCQCGNKKLCDSPTCRKCSNSRQQKVERPSYEELIKEINELGYCGVGRKYGVSDNAIRRWKKYYEKEKIMHL